MTLTGTIKMDGSLIGYIEEIITIDNQLMEAKLDQGDIAPAFDEEILSGHVGRSDHVLHDEDSLRLGHKRGSYSRGDSVKPSVRLGHKKGFHPKEDETKHEQVSGGSYGKGGGRSEANYLGSERSRAAGVESGPGKNLKTVQTKAGPITVNKDASGDMAGAVDDLVEAGAPVGHIGSYAMRNIAGSGRISQHALGGAMDLFNQSGRGIISKQGMDWIKNNPDKWRDIKAKRNLVGGEEFGDIGHVEWGGPGYGARHYGADGKEAVPKAPIAPSDGRHYGPGAPGEITGKTSPGQPVRGSWFNDRNTATGLSAREHAGIALPSREGLGKMHEVIGPNGQKVMLPQIDVGPAKWTGRGVDISKAALEKLGYNENNFPTDAQFKVNPVPKMPTQTAPMFAGAGSANKGVYNMSGPDKGTPNWGWHHGEWKDLNKTKTIEDRRAKDNSMKGISKRDALVNKFTGDYDTLKRADAIKESPSQMSTDLGINSLLKNNEKYPQTVAGFKEKFGRDPATDAEMEFYNK